MHNEKLNKVENPFIYGEIVTDKNFADRDSELKFLERDLLDGEIIFLISPRRYGKTSLIFNLFRHFKKKKVLTVYVDLYRCASLSQFLDQYLSLLLQASETKLDKITRFVSEILPAIRPKLSIKPDGTIEAEISISPVKKDLGKTIEEIIDIPYRISKKKKKKIIVVFDEFQEIRNFDGESIEKIIRSVIQHHRQVGYLFAGSKKHVIEDMIQSKDKAFYKSGKVMNLNKIDSSIFEKFIRKKFEMTDFKVGIGVIEEVFKITALSPHYVQYLCHELWDSFISSRRIEKNDVRDILKKIVSEEAPLYLTIWDDLTLHQRRVLQAIASIGGKNIFSQRYVIQNELNSTSSVQTSTRILIKKGILYREDIEYFIEDVFFKFWIQYFGVPTTKRP